MRTSNMRRLGLPAGLLGAAAIAAVALASGGSAEGQAPVPPGAGALRLTGATSPARTGTTKAPVPVGLTFTVTDAPATSGRPPTISFVRVRMTGLTLAAGSLPRCSAAQISDLGTRSCPAASRVGGGTFDGVLGQTGDASSVTGQCHLDLALYAAGPRQLTLYASGGPAAPATCPADVSAAVPIAIGRPRGATSLTFALPGEVRHPLDGFDAAMSRLVLTFPGTPIRAARGKVQFAQSAGGCSRGRRTVSGTFQDESGAFTSASSRAACATPRPTARRGAGR